MIQNVKSVLIGLTKEFGTEEVSSALGYGLSLAQQAGAHVTVQAASVKIVLTSAWTSRYAAGFIDAENRRLHALATAVAETAQADAAASGVACTVETPHLTYPDLLASFTAQARVHDLTVLDAEEQSIDVDRGLIEAVLTQSGHPLMIVPPGRTSFQSRRIILAWDGSAKAARAVSSALPFLQAAEAVEIVGVTGEKALPDTISGAELAPYLARHGIAATVKNIPARNGDVAETLRDQAGIFRADMIVMGGFVHSRLREMVFGGVTDSLLRKSPVPLFLAH